MYTQIRNNLLGQTGSVYYTYQSLDQKTYFRNLQNIYFQPSVEKKLSCYTTSLLTFVQWPGQVP